MLPASSLTSTDFLNCTLLPPNTGLTTHPSESTVLFYISWPAGTTITESKWSLLTEVVILLCMGTSVVERIPDQCQHSWSTLHIPQKTQDSFVQTSPRPCIPWLPPSVSLLCSSACSSGPHGFPVLLMVFLVCVQITKTMNHIWHLLVMKAVLTVRSMDYPN